MPAATNRPLVSRLTLPAVLLPVLLITGCGGGQSYPSLARRPAELLGTEGQALPRCPHATEACPDAPRVSGTAPVVAPEPTAPLAEPPSNASLPARLAALTAQAQAAHRDFQTRRAAAEAVAGGEPGSDGWARATTALSELQSAHGAMLAIQAEIDQLDVADRVAHPADDPAAPPRPANAAIRDAASAVGALAAEEAAAIDLVRTRLRQ